MSRVVPGVAVLEWSARISADILHGEVLDEAFGHGPVGAEPAHRKRNAERRIAEEFVQQMNNRAGGQDAAALAGLENPRESSRWVREIERDKDTVRLVNPQEADECRRRFRHEEADAVPFFTPRVPQ